MGGYRQIKPKSETLSRFTASWCRTLLEDSSLIPIADDALIPKESTEDSLFAVTLQTKSTIPYTLALYRPRSQPSEMIWMLELGEGLNGHPKILHGGMVTTILDEIIGHIVLTIQEASTVTAYLNTQFKKPVPTPGLLLARARVTKQEGRKLYASASLEDGAGGIYATAECLYIQLKANL
jgi:thioesterase superfamily protein 4